MQKKKSILVELFGHTQQCNRMYPNTEKKWFM